MGSAPTICTWLGLTASGKLAALTNYRDPAMMEDGRPSRGALVQGFLTSSLDSEAFLNELARYAHQYNPFNLLVFDGRQLMGCESRGRDYRVVRIKPGVGAVSNASFDSVWPKVAALREALGDVLSKDDATDQELLALLENREVAPDALLPKTGIPRDLERALSASFIALPSYGTRASSIVRIHEESVHMIERSFNAAGVCGDVAISRSRTG